MTDLSRRQRLLAYTLGGIGLGTNAMIYFLVPLRAVDIGVNIGVVGLLLGTKGLMEAVMSVPLGAFIDRVGPRRAYLIGSAGVGLVGLAFMAATNVVTLFVLQAALGAIRPLAWVGGQAYASGMRSEAERSYDTGRFSFVANLGQILAPIVAGLAVQSIGERMAFSVVAAYGFTFFLVALALPDTGRSAERGSTDTTGIRAAPHLLRLGEIQAVMLLTFTRLWLTSVWNSFLPVYLVSAGTSGSVAGTAVAFMAIVATSVSLLSGQVSRLGRPAVMTAAVLAVTCLGVAVTPAFTSVPAVYLPAALVGVGQGLSLPLLLVLVSAAAPEGQRSLALGLRSSVNQLAAAGAPTLVAPVIAIAGLTVGFPLAAAVGGICAVSAILVGRRRPQREPAP